MGFMEDIIKGSVKSAKEQFEEFGKALEEEARIFVDWFQKILGTLTYCGGKKWIYTVWTYEDNEDRRAEYLKAELDSMIEDQCGIGGQGSEYEISQFTGYETKPVDESEVEQDGIYEDWLWVRTPAK